MTTWSSLEAIRYAVLAAQTGSLSKAAKVAGVSQPSLSTAVRKCEENLGVELFQRTSTGVKPTEVGQKILTEMQRAVQCLENAEAIVSAHHYADQTTSLRLGVSPLIAPELLSRFLGLVRASETSCDVIIKEANMDELVADLGSQSIDLAFIPAVGEAATFRHELIGAEPVVLVTEPIHPQATGKNAKPASGIGPDVEVSSLPDRELITVAPGCGLVNYTDNLLAEFSVAEKRYPGQALSYAVLQEWVRLGLGQAILPLSKVERSSYYRKLKDGRADLEIFYEAAWLASGPKAQLIANLIEQIKIS